METREAIWSRRSVRAYLDRPVPDAALEQVLEAGLYAPSAVNFQPWYFVAVRSRDELAALTEIMGTVSARIEPDLQARFAKHPEVVAETTRFIRLLGGAPVCVLAFQQKPDYPKTAGTIIQSVAAAIENILLAATDMGLGSCWLTAPVEAEMGAVLGARYAPGKGPLTAMITLGYPAQAAKAPARKDGRYVIL